MAIEGEWIELIDNSKLNVFASEKSLTCMLNVRMYVEISMGTIKELKAHSTHHAA